MLLVVGLTYVAAAWFGHLLFSLVGKSVSLAWPASGVALAAVLRYGKPAGLVIFTAITIVDGWFTDTPIPWVLGIAFFGSMAAILAASAMQLRGHFHNDMRRISDVRALLLWGTTISSSVCAMGGVAMLCLAGTVGWPQYWKTVAFWAMGDALGILLVTPLFLQMTEPSHRHFPWNTGYTLWLGAIALLSALIFSNAGINLTGFGISPLIFLPLVIWGAHQYSLGTVSAGLLLIFSGAFLSHLMGFGYYAEFKDLITIEPWLMMTTLTISGLMVSAGNAQRIAAEQLAASRRLHGWMADSNRNLNSMLQDLCDEASKQISNGSCAIVLSNEKQTGVLDVVAFAGNPQLRRKLERLMTAGNTPVHHVLADARILGTSSLQQLARHTPTPEAFDTTDFPAVASLPIISGASVLGLVCFLTQEKHRHVNTHNWQIIERIARQSAVLIEHKRNTDILRHQRANQEAERALQRSLIDTNPDLIFVKDLEGRYLLCNRAFEAYADRTEHEMLGLTDFELFGKQTGEEYRKHDAAMLRTATPRHNEEWITYPDGRHALLDTLKSPLLDASGNICGIVGICRDITQQRTLERELVTVTENRQRSIGQELHDNLGQQLVAITYLAKALEQKTTAMDIDLSHHAAMLVSQVQTAVAECKQLSRNLVPVELESNGLVAALQALSQRTAHTFGVRCNFRCNQEVLVHDITQALNLYRIAQEAISNSIRHGAASEIEIRLQQTSNTLMLMLRDNGCGMIQSISGLKKDGMGIKIMRHRAALIGAEMHILAPEPGGVEIVVTLEKSA
jgi:PAS domain S-box-containing protein